MMGSRKELVFLGSSGCITVPAFFCECSTCEAARRDPGQRRTRASLAMLGEETVLIDAAPDLDWQLEREGIRKPDRIFITHWHYDHVWGLASLGEPASCAKWTNILVYGTEDVVDHFDQELAYLKNIVDGVVEPHVIEVGDTIKLPDATWEVVKTKHEEHSVGFIVDSDTRFAYLVDGVVPPAETVDRIGDLDLLIIESTMDFLDKRGWTNFRLEDATRFWEQTGAPECILTHLTCHGWENGTLLAGLTPEERTEYEKEHPGLRFAYDGMRVPLGNR